MTTDRELQAEEVAAVAVYLNQFRIERPRQWGACWVALTLWSFLKLSEFWRERLPASREGTHWLNVLITLVAYRLIDPGSEWRLHRHWYAGKALPAPAQLRKIATFFGGSSRRDPRSTQRLHPANDDALSQVEQNLPD